MTMHMRLNDDTNFKTVDGKLNLDAIKTAAQNHLASRVIESYAPVLEKRAHETDTNESFDLLSDLIHTLKEKGYALNQTIQLLKDIKISRAFTPHPTEHLSPEGIKLIENLVLAAEAPASKREAAIQEASQAIRDSKTFSAAKKSNILDEIDASNERALIQHMGCNILERHINDCIEAEYGQRPHFWLDIGPRSWDFDADGKPNAEGWAMMAKLSTTTMGSLNVVANTLTQAIETLPNADQFPDLQNLLTKIEAVQTALTPVYKNARDTVRFLATESAEIRAGAYYEAREEYFETVQKFASIYDAVGSKNRGFDFYRDEFVGYVDKNDGTVHVGTLDKLRKEIGKTNPEVAEMLDDAFRIVRRTGLALEKGQTRQNDQIHTKIIDNLFCSPEFQQSGILNSSEIKEINETAIYNHQSKQVSPPSLALLPKDRQQALRDKVLKYVQINGNRKDVIALLEGANPLRIEPNGTGFPDQEATYLDRFQLRALFPLKFAEGVISDAGEHAAQQQQFIAEIYSMGTMSHMALNEDPKTLPMQAPLMADYVKANGILNRETRKEKHVEIQGADIVPMHVMRPCSDSGKIDGIGTGLQADEQYRAMIRTAFLTKNPILFQLGGGLAMNRFGGDISIVRRIAAQELKKIAQERGHAFDRLNPEDREMMHMAASIMWTEQGRAKRLYTATPNQVADDFAGKIAEIIEDRLDLENLVPDYTYIDEAPELSPKVAELQNKIAWRMREGYRSLRFAVDAGGEHVLSKLGDRLTNPNMVGYMNNGARPASKSGKKDILNVRAIENDERMMGAELFHNGFYAGGIMMRNLHTYANDGLSPITEDTTRALIENPVWDYNIFARALVDAQRFNVTRNFDRLAKLKDWDFDRTLAVGRRTGLLKLEGSEHHLLDFDNQNGSVTAEQAYLAKIWVDRLEFLALTEAALSPAGLQRSLDDIINEFRPADNGLEFGAGPKTLEKWPHVTQIIEEHQKNDVGYDLLYFAEDYIQGEINKGRSKKEIEADFGGEETLRLIDSAWRAGTMAHTPLWTGEYSYGVHNRRETRAAQQHAKAKSALDAEQDEHRPDITLN